MKHIKRPALLLALVLLISLCAACVGPGDQAEGKYVLYFTVSRQSSHGSALGTQIYNCGETDQETECPDPGALLQALLAGPEAESGLTSPFPKGTALQSWEWDPEREGVIQVWLSEQYSGLTDISLTLADYCIVLTLAQLEGVESVEISSEGHTANYRSHQLLTAEEVQLTDDWGRS